MGLGDQEGRGRAELASERTRLLEEDVVRELGQSPPSHLGAVAPRSRRSWHRHPARSARRGVEPSPDFVGNDRQDLVPSAEVEQRLQLPHARHLRRPHEPAGLRGDLRPRAIPRAPRPDLLGTTAGTRSWRGRARAPVRGRPPRPAGSPPHVVESLFVAELASGRAAELERSDGLVAQVQRVASARVFSAHSRHSALRSPVSSSPAFRA